ncbi:MAG TPA: hypothetical protein VJH20_02865 [Candidatus Nanoarchaeia archaeon]|nr:hypothetical protein [Candidatus Nanoarchaeia archaeon]
MHVAKRALIIIFLSVFLSELVVAQTLDDVVYQIQNFIPFYKENFALLDFVIYLAILFLPIRMILEKRWESTGVKLAFVISIAMSIGIVYSEVEKDQSYIVSYAIYVFPIFIAAIIIHFLRHKGLSNLKSFILVGAMAIAVIAFLTEKINFNMPQPYRAIFMVVLVLVLLYLGYLLLKKVFLREDRRLRDRLDPSNKPRQNNSNNPSQQQTVVEKVRYEQRRRTQLDLQKSYDYYLFKIFRKGITPHERTRMLNAMNIIQSQAQKQGCNIRGKKPWEIAQSLRANNLI